MENQELNNAMLPYLSEGLIGSIDDDPYENFCNLYVYDKIRLLQALFDDNLKGLLKEKLISNGNNFVNKAIPETQVSCLRLLTYAIQRDLEELFVAVSCIAGKSKSNDHTTQIMISRAYEKRFCQDFLHPTKEWFIELLTNHALNKVNK